jgi:hypothetical protein
MRDTCSNYFYNAMVGHVECIDDVLGGHCAPTLTNPLKDIGKPCMINADCLTGKCERPSTYSGKICIPNIVCEPDDILPNDPQDPLSCTAKCSHDGLLWLVEVNECSNYQEPNTRFCEGNTAILKNNWANIEFGTNCYPGICTRGMCVSDLTGSCQFGESSYVQGSCSGVSGCPDPSINYSGNCLATCDANGNWKIDNGCGKFTFSLIMSDQIRQEILSVASRMRVPFNNSIFFLRFWQHFNEVSLASASYNRNDNIINIYHYGVSGGIYAHEIAHYFQHNNPSLLNNYSRAVGCKQNKASSESFEFIKENPVSTYGAINCREAMAEATEKYYSDMCSMQKEYPIQYNWMKNNMFTEDTCCGCGVGYAPPHSSLTDLASTTPTRLMTPLKPNVKHQNDNFSDSFFEKISNKYSVIEDVQAQSPVPHRYSFSIGSSLSAVKSELGSPRQTIQKNNIKILVYSSADVTLDNVFYFNNDNKLIYFRLYKNNLKSRFRNYPPFTTEFGEPEAKVYSNVDYRSTRYMYPSQGFTVVVQDDTNEVVQYEAFFSTSLDEYLSIWGNDVDKLKVEQISAPKITPTPTPDVPGDGDGDGVVNIDDYVIWFNNYQEVLGGNNYGDYYPDDFIDGLDYVIWLTNFGS